MMSTKTPATTVHVFVSSTWLDLQLERAAVETSLQRLRETKFVSMEYFGSRDEGTRRTSLDEVDRSQVYVGIFAWRYGYIPPGQEAWGWAFTEGDEA
jgi:hypothetical protein